MSTISQITIVALTILSSRAALCAEFVIETKSFIMPVSFEGVYTIEAGILAAITNASFSENPTSSSPSTRDFRLWSSAVIGAECIGDKISAIRLSEAKIAVGSEAFVLEARGELSQRAELFNLAPDDVNSLRRFRWEMRGRPHAATLATFYVHDYRSCTWIWHRVEGAVSCNSGQPSLTLSLSGSGFPSHRAWVNNKVTAFRQQGPFERLWSCSPTDPSRVR